MIKIEEYYGSPFEKWAKSFSYKNFWRVQHIVGNVEDMEAQCSLFWVQCYQFYQETVHDDALMMYMFKLWVSGQIHDMSSKDTKHKERIVQAPSDQSNFNSELFAEYSEYKKEPSVHGEAELQLKLDKASDELKEVLKIFLYAPKEIMDVLREDCKSACPKTFFKKVVKHLGMDETKAPQLSKELQSLLA